MSSGKLSSNMKIENEDESLVQVGILSQSVAVAVAVVVIDLREARDQDFYLVPTYIPSSVS